MYIAGSEICPSSIFMFFSLNTDDQAWNNSIKSY
jgi:hypothetical protein